MPTLVHRALVYRKNQMIWKVHHPDVTVEHLGLIPCFLYADDERGAKEQFDARYRLGGFHPFGAGKWKADADRTLHYPEDPPLEPWASTNLRDETVVQYQSGIVAIFQKDGSFQVARMD